jgi:hypothetical protein
LALHSAAPESKGSAVNLTRNGWNLSVEKYPSEVQVFNVTPAGAAFVARFKHARPRSSAAAFVKFLVANFTPREYFALTGERQYAPLVALKTKGYVSPNEAQARAYAARVFA